LTNSGKSFLSSLPKAFFESLFICPSCSSSGVEAAFPWWFFLWWFFSWWFFPWWSSASWFFSGGSFRGGPFQAAAHSRQPNPHGRPYFCSSFFPRVARRGAQIDCMRWAIFPLEGSFPALSVSAISGVAVLLGPSAVLMLDAASGAVPVPVLARGWCAGLSFVEAPRGFRAAGAVAASDGSEAALPTSSP
jgi:hypothetical protein